MKHLIRLLLLFIGATDVSYSGHTSQFFYTLDDEKKSMDRNIKSYYNLCKQANISPTKFWRDNFGG